MQLRIMMLAPFGIRPKGTLAARMLPLAQALVARGHQVHILAPPMQNPQDAGRRAMLGGVLVEHTRLPNLPGPAGVAQQVALLLHPALAAKPDILHLFKPKGFSGLAALIAQIVRPGLPLVVDSDDWEGWGGWNDLLPYPRPAKTLFAWQERDLPRRAAAVTVVSRTLQAQVSGFGVPPARVFYLPNGTVADDQRPTTNDQRPTTNDRQQAAAGEPQSTIDNRHAAILPTILLYTRFWEFDLRQVVAVLVAIVACQPTARLLVVGAGEHGEEHELRRRAERAGVAHALDLRGWVEPEAIPALLATADLAISPLDDTLINRARGLAKLLELMQAGLPIVAGHVGQAAEYLEHGVSGWLVPPGNPGALAHAVLALLGDTALRARLAHGARQAAAAYAWPALAPIAEAAYLAALGHTR